MTAATKRKEGLVVAEEFMTGEAADLIGLVTRAAVGCRGLFIQRDQLLLFLAVSSARAIRKGGKTVTLGLEGWVRIIQFLVCW